MKNSCLCLWPIHSILSATFNPTDRVMSSIIKAAKYCHVQMHFLIICFHVQENDGNTLIIQSEKTNPMPTLEFMQFEWLIITLNFQRVAFFFCLSYNTANMLGDIATLPHLYHVVKFSLVITQYRQDLKYIGVRWNSLLFNMFFIRLITTHVWYFISWVTLQSHSLEILNTWYGVAVWNGWIRPPQGGFQ